MTRAMTRERWCGTSSRACARNRLAPSTPCQLCWLLHTRVPGSHSMRCPSSDFDIVNTGESTHEVPTGCTPVVDGALSQVLPSQTTCWLAVESKASLSTSVHGPPSTGGAGVPIAEAVVLAACAGSASFTAGGTSPARDATA